MVGATYFLQEFPTCGRRIQVRVNHLGKRVACSHCSAQFTSCDPQSPEYPALNSGLKLLARVDQRRPADPPSLQTDNSESRYGERRITLPRETPIRRLALYIQEQILFLPRKQQGHDVVKEADVRHIAGELDWRKQRRLWAALQAYVPK